VIIRNVDYQSRTRAGNNLALERIGKRKACRNQNNEANQKSNGEYLHG
jgi:hypothetical protein